MYSDRKIIPIRETSTSQWLGSDEVKWKKYRTVQSGAWGFFVQKPAIWLERLTSRLADWVRAYTLVPIVTKQTTYSSIEVEYDSIVRAIVELHGDIIARKGDGEYILLMGVEAFHRYRKDPAMTGDDGKPRIKDFLTFQFPLDYRSRVTIGGLDTPHLFRGMQVIISPWILGFTLIPKDDLNLLMVPKNEGKAQVLVDNLSQKL